MLFVGTKKSSPIVFQPPPLIQYGSMTRVYFLFDISKSNIVNLKNKKKSLKPHEKCDYVPPQRRPSEPMYYIR